MHVITQSCLLFIWAHTLNVVTAADCRLADFLSSGHYDSHFDTSGLAESYPPGEQVRVSCQAGYVGFFKLTCLLTGWSPLGSRCEPKSCGHPGDADFAEFNLVRGEDFVFGAEVQYTCKRGYQMVSRSSSRRCMVHGWDGFIPVCQAINCPVIEAKHNVQISGDREEATYGSVLRFSCKSREMILAGPTEIHCDENGRWSSPDPSCTELKCTHPMIQNGRPPANPNAQYSKDEVLRFSCEDNFKPSHHLPSKCTRVGNRADWNPTPLCVPVTCSLTPVPSTRYEGDGRRLFSPGDTVTVKCDYGYFIDTHREDNKVITCQGTGEWDISPVCSLITCRNPTFETGVASPRWEPTKRLGDTVYYRCTTGYKATDVGNTGICTRDGWTPTPLCEEITCGIPNIPNAEVHSQKTVYKYKETVGYQCLKDGVSAALRQVTCNRDGWSLNQRCPEIKCRISNIPNAEVHSQKTVYKYMETAVYQCLKDGVSAALRQATCDRHGWSLSQRCPEIKCGPIPNIQNAEMHPENPQKTDYEYRETVRYRCQTDGASAPWREATCDRHGWSGFQSCSARCELPEVKNGFGHPGEDGVKFFYTCHENYKQFYKGRNATCNDGVWLKPPRCIDKNACGEIPQIPHANITKPETEDYAAGQRVTFDCEERYNLRNSHITITCENGNWTFTNYTDCEPIGEPCGPPLEVKHAVPMFEKNEKEYLSETEVKYECSHKYKMEGTDKDGPLPKCKDGHWEQKDIRCVAKNCPAPPWIEDIIIMPGNNGPFPVDHNLTFSCTHGKKLDGQSVLTCGEDEKWGGEFPSCKAMSCPAPPQIADMTILPNNNGPFPVGHTLRFSCPQGKKLSGQSVLTCGEDEKWGGEFPSCKDVTCPALHGTDGPQRVGQQITYKCPSPQRVHSGSSQLICLETGEWNTGLPSCKVSCDVPKLPADVTITNLHNPPPYLWEGNVLKFECRHGLYLQGSKKITCLGNGNLSGEVPSCSASDGCEKPPPLDDGDYRDTARDQYHQGERVHYVCQSYYTLEGESRTCHNGQWVGDVKCLKPCTVNEDDMNQNNIRFRYSYENKLYPIHNDHLTFMCRGGLTMHGNARQQCVDGDITLPSCS